MSNKGKLEKALELLGQISSDWNESQIEHYPSDLMSFDKLVQTMGKIRFKDIPHPVIDYKAKVMEYDYEIFTDFLVECTQERIESDDIVLREAAEDIVSEVFDQLRDDKTTLDKLFKDANEVLEPPCKDDTELEDQILETIVDQIHDNEVYMAGKTNTFPRQDRL